MVQCAPRARRKVSAPRISRRRRSRGQALVEFALVAPVFFLMFFGIIEFALINASITTFNFAAKDSARIGSVLGRTDATVDQQIVNDIVGRVGGVVVAKASLIEVFRSDAAGDPPAAVTPVENTYTPVTGSACGVCNWAIDSRNDSLLNADYLGVRITYVYTYLTAFVSGGASQLQLTALSVQRIEPQSFQGHRPHPPMVVASAYTSPRASCSHATVSPVLAPASSGSDSAPCVDEPLVWLREPVSSLVGLLAHSIGGAA